MKTMGLTTMTDKELLALARKWVDEMYFRTNDDDTETLKRLEEQHNELTMAIIKLNRGIEW